MTHASPDHYRLTYGATGLETVTLQFSVMHFNDAVVRFSEAVLNFDSDHNLSAAFAMLEVVREDERRATVVSWTKTSDERPTERGKPVPNLRAI